MGWPKYDEDIREAIDERLAMSMIRARYVHKTVVQGTATCTVPSVASLKQAEQEGKR